MNMLSMLAAMALAVAPDASFEAEGIRVDGKLVKGPVVHVLQADGQMMLVSGAVLETINAELRVSLDAEHVLVLEPGIRVTRREGGILLSAHGNRPFEIAGHAVSGPTLVTPAAEGWTAKQITVKGKELRVALPSQDEGTEQEPAAEEQPGEQEPYTADKALKDMKGDSDRARRILGMPAAKEEKLRYRNVTTGDPTVVGNGVDSDVIKPLPKISPVDP